MTDIEDGQGEWMDKDRRLWLLRVPRHVRNPAKYYDRTVQDWHRHTFDNSSDAIDLDLVGYCHEYHCRQLLYVIEAAEADTKHTSVLMNVARSNGAVALLIIHQRRQVLRGRRVYPAPSSEWLTPEQLEHYMTRIRLAHRRLAHGEPSTDA